MRHLLASSLLLVGLTLVNPVEAQQSPVTASVEGRIVQQDSGLPLRKANVSLVNVTEDPSNETAYAGSTDAQGHFTISGIPPGEYRLYFDCPGFVEAEKRHHGSGMRLSLAAGDQVKGLLLHMAPAAILSGRVTDVDGDPVPNVTVAAFPLVRTKLHSSGAGSETNEKGEYRIGGLAPIPYFIVAQPIGQLSRAVQMDKATNVGKEVYATTYYPGTTDKNQAVPMAFHPGDELVANIPLRVAHLFHVRGVVVNAPQGMNEQVEVTLRPLDEDSVGIIQPWRVDKEGNFEIRGVLPGTYRILFGVSSGRSNRYMRADQTLQVTTTDVDDLRISMVANGQVTGRIRMDNDQKIDWSQFEVSLISRRQSPPMLEAIGSGNAFDPLYWDERTVHVPVKADGTFEVKEVPADTYRVMIASTNSAFRDYFIKSVTLAGRNLQDSGLIVGGSKYPLEIVVSANGGRIDGIVVGDKKQPVSDAEVVCVPAATPERYELYGHAGTDSHGGFSLRGITPGDYRVFAFDSAFDEDYLDPKFLRAHESVAKTIRVGEGEHKTTELKVSGGTTD